MGTLKKYGLRGFCAALALCASAGANAIPYDFDVEYNGGAISLDAGSDNPIGQLLVAGDSFNFNAQTVGTDFWKVETAGNFFPFFAFIVSESDTRNGTMSLDLLLDGVSQFAIAPQAIVNSNFHIGTNAVSLTAGLMFDEVVMDYALISTDAAGPTTIVGYHHGDYFPGGFTEGISYNRGQINPAPAPATLALLGIGLAALGWRRRRHA